MELNILINKIDSFINQIPNVVINYYYNMPASHWNLYVNLFWLGIMFLIYEALLSKEYNQKK